MAKADLFYPNGTPFHYKPDQIIGQGNEGIVVDAGRGMVAKIYFGPTHPNFAGNALEQAGALKRLIEHQHKLPAFPSGMPNQAVAPVELLKDSKGKIAGYTMPFIKGGQILMRYSDLQFRAGIPFAVVKKLILDLYDAYQGIHKAGAVIGDYNDRNVLVLPDGEVRVVDADSWQYGRWLCSLFTTKFLDPLVSDPKELMLVKPHSQQTDHFAFAMMVYELLTLHGVFDLGRHKPADPKKRAKGPTERVLRRIPAWDPDVHLPSFVYEPIVLPDDLMQYMEGLVKHDKRQPMPRKILEALEERVCAQTGKIHYRRISPFVAGAPAAASVEKTTVIGNLTATRQFRTSGLILFASSERGGLKYLYQEGDWLIREGGVRIRQEVLDPTHRYRIVGDKTIVADGNTLHVYKPGSPSSGVVTDIYQNQVPVVAANSRHYYWTSTDTIYRDDFSHFGVKTREDLGSVYSRQTLIWVGEELGFGFYRIGEGAEAFIFDPVEPGKIKLLKDNSPHIKGELLDISCTFSSQFFWLTTATQEGPDRYHHAYLYSRSGELINEHSSKQGEDDWLADTIRGYAATGSILFVPTADGLTSVELKNGTFVVRVFPDTTKYVNARTNLFIGSNGIYAVNRNEIYLLQMK